MHIKKVPVLPTTVVTPTDGKVVTAGSIIVRQHGTRFHVGKNVGMGRDYTIYAKIAGVVRFGRHGRTERIISVEPLEAKEA